MWCLCSAGSHVGNPPTPKQRADFLLNGRNLFSLKLLLLWVPIPCNYYFAQAVTGFEERHTGIWNLWRFVSQHGLRWRGLPVLGSPPLFILPVRCPTLYENMEVCLGPTSLRSQERSVCLVPLYHPTRNNPMFCFLLICFESDSPTQDSRA